MCNIMDTGNHHIKSYQIKLVFYSWLQSFLRYQKLAFSFGTGIYWCATDLDTFVVTGKGIFEPKKPFSSNSRAPRMNEQIKYDKALLWMWDLHRFSHWNLKIIEETGAH